MLLPSVPFLQEAAAHPARATFCVPGLPQPPPLPSGPVRPLSPSLTPLTHMYQAVSAVLPHPVIQNKQAALLTAFEAIPCGLKGALPLFFHITIG